MSNQNHIFSNDTKLRVGTLYCIGKNYADHAKEMGGSTQKDPIVFLKSPQAYFNESYVFELPDYSNNVHHECEMVAVIGKSGRNISEEDALDHVMGIGVGIDFTARDIQQDVKDKGHPWTFAKSFYRSSPVSTIYLLDEFESDLFDISLKLNGKLKQKANTSEMVHSLPHLISYLSKYFLLEIGDCIFTGTPAGVGPVKMGDELEVEISGKKGFTLRVVK